MLYKYHVLAMFCDYDPFYVYNINYKLRTCLQKRNKLKTYFIFTKNSVRDYRIFKFFFSVLLMLEALYKLYILVMNFVK